MTKTSLMSQLSALKRNRNTLFTVSTLLAVSVVVYLVLALLAALLMQDDARGLTVNHLTRDSLLSQHGTVFAGAGKPVFDLSLRWAVVGIMLISSILPLLCLTSYRRNYETTIGTRRFFAWRWVDLAVSSALMVEVIAILCGVNDIMTLKLMGGLIGVCVWLSALTERKNETAKQPVWDSFWPALFAGAMPWVLIGVTKSATLLFGAVRSPWYAYAVCVTTLLGFTALAYNQLQQHRRAGAWKAYANVERNYLIINMVTRSAFALILLIGLSK